MRLKCIGAQSVPRPGLVGPSKGVLALCRRDAGQGEHRTYVKPPGTCQLPNSAVQLCLF